MPIQQSVTRTWKRDSSQNHMPLDRACANIVGNTGMTYDDVRMRLLAYEQVETKLAQFRLTNRGDVYHAPDQQAAGRVNPNNGHPSIVPSQEELLGVQ